MFIWLCWVSVVACRVFSYGTWDLVLWPRMEPGPLRWEGRVLAPGPAGKSQVHFYLFQWVCLFLAVWVFIAVWAFFGDGEWGLLSRCGARAAHGSGCSAWGACGLRSCGSRAPAQAPQLWHADVAALWQVGLLGPGTEPMSPAWAGGLVTTELPRKPTSMFLKGGNYCSECIKMCIPAQKRWIQW